MTSSKENGSHKILRWIPGVVISAIALYAVIHFAQMDGFLEALRTVKPGFILVIALLAVASLFIRAVAWKTILGDQVSLSTSFFGVSEGYFLNNLFPFRAGEVGRALFVGKSSGLGTFHVLSTVVIERAFDIFFAAGIVLVTLPFIVGSDWIKPVAFTAFLLVVFAMMVLFLIANNRQKFQAWIDKRNFQSSFLNFKIIPQIQKLIDGMSTLVNPGRFLISLFWIGANWVLWMFLYHTAISQISPHAPLWWGAFVSALLALGVAIPSAPAALGVFEAAFVGSVAVLGISSSSALAYAFILHLNQIVISTVFGLWGLVRDGQRFSQLMTTLAESANTQVIKS